MSRLPLLIVCLLAPAVASCDAADPLSVRTVGVYDTSVSDQPLGVVQADDGGLIVYGRSGYLTDVASRIRLYPIILTMDQHGEPRDTILFDDGDSGQVRSVVPVDNELVALITARPAGDLAPDSLHVVRIAPDGMRRRICSFGNIGRSHLIPSRASDYLLFRSAVGFARYNVSCEEMWSLDLSVSRVAETTSGDLGLVVANDGHDAAIVSLTIDGDVRWRTPIPSDRFVAVRDLAVVGGEVVVTGSIDRNGRNDETFVTRVTGSGELLWHRTYEATEPWGQTIDRAGGGGIVLTYETLKRVDAGEDVLTIHVLRLDAEGSVLWRTELRGQDEVRRVVDVLLLRDGRLALIGYTFPNPVSWSFDHDITVDFIDAL